VYPALHEQAATVVLETGAFAFAGHDEHVDKALAPTTVENVAVPQSVHAALPVTILYLPATHAEHVPPFAPVYPALHEQAATVVLETGAFAFAGHDEHVDKALAPTTSENVAVPQSVHAALPVTILYLPATHAVHVPPFAPVNPALHKQATTVVLETGAFAFAGHDEHVDKALAPTTAENFAASQSVHAALPLLVLYLPATHAVH
jgi:hypothetical protein